ncbi:MAG: hypothetical protein ACRYGR_01795 [Janthinobacterium lividum]
MKKNIIVLSFLGLISNFAVASALWGEKNPARLESEIKDNKALTLRQKNDFYSQYDANLHENVQSSFVEMVSYYDKSEHSKKLGYIFLSSEMIAKLMLEGFTFYPTKKTT